MQQEAARERQRLVSLTQNFAGTLYIASLNNV